MVLRLFHTLKQLDIAAHQYTREYKAGTDFLLEVAIYRTHSGYKRNTRQVLRSHMGLRFTPWWI